MRPHPVLSNVHLDYTYERGDDWQDRALCAEIDAEFFFPERGAPAVNAKAICRRCPVISECLEAALARNERWGVYGGMSLRERNKLAKDRREAAA